MVYDTPKAAHFDAYLKGKGKLADNDPVGLEYRWAAAARVQQEAVSDMLRYTSNAIKDIREVLQMINCDREIVVTLRGFDEQWSIANREATCGTAAATI